MYVDGGGVLDDPASNAQRAFDAFPRNRRLRARSLAHWAPAVERIVAADPAVLPLELVGTAELFDDPMPTPPHHRRSDVTFVVGGAEVPRRLVLGIGRGARDVVSLRHGDAFDDFRRFDAQQTFGGGWIVVQFTRRGDLRFSLGFDFFNGEQKPRASRDADALLAALRRREIDPSATVSEQVADEIRDGSTRPSAA